MQCWMLLCFAHVPDLVCCHRDSSHISQSWTCSFVCDHAFQFGDSQFVMQSCQMFAFSHLFTGPSCFAQYWNLVVSQCV